MSAQEKHARMLSNALEDVLLMTLRESKATQTIKYIAPSSTQSSSSSSSSSSAASGGGGGGGIVDGNGANDLITTSMVSSLVCSHLAPSSASSSSISHVHQSMDAVSYLLGCLKRLIAKESTTAPEIADDIKE